jgi:ubiquinone/menaquinone biosynthesis C-methylase UbiE
VLDVGCGHADVHQFLRDCPLRLELTGVDVARNVIDSNRGRYPDNRYDSYAGRTLPYEDASFDAAFAICVMHHVPPAQWVEFLKEMRRVVRPGGRVIVIEHNPLNPVTQHIVRTCPIDANAVLLGSRTLTRLLRDCGFSSISRRFVMFAPFDGAIWRTIDLHLGWLPFGAQYYASATR